MHSCDEFQSEVLYMSRVYGFSVGEAPSSAFYMTADGVHVPLHLARVSAWPINRRWPGHQRSI